MSLHTSVLGSSAIIFLNGGDKMDQKILLKFVFAVVFLIVIGLFGYFIFLGFMNKNQVLLSLFPLAVVAGLASFFSPCAFPLLPAALTATSKPNAKSNPLNSALTAAIGVLSFLLLLGLVIGTLGASLSQFLQDNLRIVRGIVGIFLLYLAYRQFSEKFHFSLFEKFAPKASSPFLYGFGYTLVGSGCTIPILGGLTLGAVASAGFMAGFTSFGIAGATMAILMFTFVGMTAYFGRLPKTISAATPKIKRLSAIVLFLVGLFYIANALFRFI